MNNRLTSILSTSIKIIIVFIITISLLEFCYRYYIIDFYKLSWQSLNTPKELNQSNVDLLVFGDSFSASDQGYVSQLKKNNTKHVILNASSSGIGIEQVNLFATQRIKQVSPKAILYQVYVGNDLLDLKSMTNWNSLSLARNIYWKVSDYFISTTYLNQRLGMLRKHETIKTLNLDRAFSKDLYNKRTKLYIQSDNEYLYKTVTISDDFSPRYSLWKDEMDKFIAKIPTNIKVYVLFIPHCSQVNNFYLHNMKQLGARFKNEDCFLKDSYPYFNKATKDFKEHKNLIFLNPLSYLRSVDCQNKRLYYENDIHFTQQGHIELANYLKPLVFQD